MQTFALALVTLFIVPSVSILFFIATALLLLFYSETASPRERPVKVYSKKDYEQDIARYRTELNDLTEQLEELKTLKRIQKTDYDDYLNFIVKTNPDIKKCKNNIHIFTRELNYMKEMFKNKSELSPHSLFKSKNSTLDMDETGISSSMKPII